MSFFILSTYTIWWFQPIWKILVKLHHFQKSRVENKKSVKLPPSMYPLYLNVFLHSCFSLSLYPWIKPEDLCHPQRFQEMPSMWLVCTANAHGMWDIPAWAQRAPHWSRRLPASRQKWWISMELLLHFWVDMEAILYLPRIPWFHSGFGWVFVKLLKPYWFPPSTLLSLKRALEFPRKHLGVSMCFFSTRKSKQENSSLLWNKIYIYIYPDLSLGAAKLWRMPLWINMKPVEIVWSNLHVWKAHMIGQNSKQSSQCH